MPKMLGEWVFLGSMGLLYIAKWFSFVITLLFLVGSLVLGYRQGFSLSGIILSSVFLLLTIGHPASWFYLIPKKGSMSLWSNLLGVIFRFIYLALAISISYIIFSEEIPAKNFWILLGVATIFVVSNLPWMIFHLLLCFPKYRTGLKEFDQRINSDSAD